MAAFEPRVYEYHTHLTWETSHKGVAGVEGFPEMHIDCPREFGGDGKDWTPEHLLVASVEDCIMTTFIAMVERRKMQFISYSSAALGKAQLVNGVFRFSEIIVKPSVTIAADADMEKISELLHRAHRKCMVSSSLLTEVKMEPEVRKAARESAS